MNKKGYNILKSYDFPIASRMEKEILTKNHIQDYFKKKKNEKPQIKYSCFNFLIFLAKTVDLATAVTIAKQIYEEKLDIEVIESLIESYLGY